MVSAPENWLLVWCGGSLAIAVRSYIQLESEALSFNVGPYSARSFVVARRRKVAL